MAAPLIGAGYLRVIDLLQDVSFFLIEPVVNDSFPASIAAGVQTVNVVDPALYAGCVLVVGATGTSLEVITVTTVTGTNFTANFANAHAAGEPILGATFPVRFPTDPLFEQGEMLAYLSQAFSDFYTECPLVYNLADISVAASEQNTPLPVDSLLPVRVALETDVTNHKYYPLRETSQANLDGMYYQWNNQGLSQPRVYFRDKIPQQNIGIWPRVGNLTKLQTVYAQREKQVMGWGDGFLIPDPFVIYPFYKTLSFAYSKDGEMRNPGLAKYFQSRYDLGVKVANMILEVVNDSTS